MSTILRVGQRAKPFLDLGAERWRKTVDSGLASAAAAAAAAADGAADALVAAADDDNDIEARHASPYFEYQQLNPYDYSVPHPPLPPFPVRRDFPARASSHYYSPYYSGNGGGFGDIGSAGGGFSGGRGGGRGGSIFPDAL